MDDDRNAVSLVVPTYREVENLPLLVDRLEAVRRASRLDLQVLIMDDDSQDGSREWVDAHAPEWVRIVIRTNDHGLSAAVLDGLRRACHPYVVVMDADLSHPPEKIPEMLAALRSGTDFVIGSRYVPGASTDESWGALRWLNSRLATWMARPLTSARDPMAGFFGIRRDLVAQATDLNPIGYKIGLELLVKCPVRTVREIPIHFADRKLGTSKLNLREQLRYVQHLSRLYRYQFTGERRRAA